MTTIENFYVMDTSSLINLKMESPKDIFPGVWKKIEALIDEGRLLSPEEVMNEIEMGHLDDELIIWTKENRRMFKRLNTTQIQKVKEIQEKFPALVDPEKETPDADPFVIALALEQKTMTTIDGVMRRTIVVTDERKRGKKIKIPLVCEKMDVECIDRMELFRREGWKF
jgi:hypothetical protein